MEISAVGSANTPASALSANSLAKNFDTFLTLLTTQLKNQDPLEPLRTEQFTQQLVQFTGVEQAIATNKRLDEMLEVYRSGYAANLVNYLGRTVSAKGAVTSLTDSQANWNYTLLAPADQVTLNIFDQNNNLVWTGGGDPKSGSHALDWNGANTAGQQLPDGIYRLQVVAKDAAGGDVATEIIVQGVVSGIEAVGGITFLEIGGQKVPLGDVLAIHSTPAQNPG